MDGRSVLSLALFPLVRGLEIFPGQRRSVRSGERGETLEP